ncbi:MAG: sodium/solute symporter [Planctomycetes bacterium]|nr:sodium/solute symporter [Planctomycetota bacterium]
MNLGATDIVVLLGYLAGIMAMGLYFARRNVSTEEYFVGGRSFKGWVVGLSLVGTSISSISFLAFPGDAYKTAYLRMVPNFMLPVALVIVAYLVLPFYRKNRIISAYQYLEMRFGPRVRVYGALTFIAGQVMRTSGILYLLSMLIQGVTDLSPIACILVGGVFVALYTVVGGISAVMWTDVIQTIVLAGGGLLCLGVVIHKLPGGIDQIIEVGSAADKFSFAELRDGTLQPARWDFTLQSKTAMMMLVLGLTNWLYEYSTIQYTVQRYAASRSTRAARQAMFVAAVASIPIWLFFMFLGTALWVFYQQFPTQEAADMLTGAGGAKAEDVLPYFIVNELPAGLSGLVVAAALAAAMSSLDSSLNAIATVGVIDIYRRHLVKDRDDRHYLVIARWVATAASVLMIVGAIVFHKAESKTLQDTLTTLTSILAGGLLGLYFFGMLTTRGDGRAAGFAIICTLVFTTWTVMAGKGWLPWWLNLPFETYYTSIVGHVVMFAAGYVAALLFFKVRKPLRNLTIWTHEDEPENG